MPTFQAIDTVNAGAAFTEEQITEALGSSKTTLQESTLFPTDPSNNPRTREYSSLQSLDMSHLCLLTPFEDNPSSDEIAEMLRLVVPRSLRSLSLRHCLPEYQIDVMIE